MFTNGFSCGAAGNVVKFIMEHEQLTYPEALKWLANKYHIEVHERELTSEEKQRRTNENQCSWSMSGLQSTLMTSYTTMLMGWLLVCSTSVAVVQR